MGKDRLEDYIKGQVYDYDSVVNTDELWDSIQKKKKPRRFLWIYFVFGVALLGSLLSIVVFKDLDKASSVSSTQSSKLANQKEIITNDNLYSESNNDSVVQIIDLRTKTNVNNTDLENPNYESIEKFRNRNTQTSENKFREENISLNKVSSLVTIENKVSAINIRISRSSDLNKNNLQNDKVDGSFKIFQQTSDTILTGKKDRSSNNVIVDKKNRAIINNDNRNALLQSSDLKELLALYPLGINRLYYERPLVPNQNVNSIIPLDNKNDKAGHWYTGIGFNFLKGQRNLVVADSSNEKIDTSLLDLRESKEQFMESFGAQLTLGYQHSKGVFFNTGISFQQINDRSIIDFQESETTFVGNESAFLQSNSIRSSVRYNKIRMIDIPLSIGLYKSIKNLSVSTSAGININLLTATSGNIVESENSFSTTTDGDIFKKNIFFSYEWKVGFHYQFSNNVELGIYPTLRYYPNSFTSDTYALEQRYIMYGFFDNLIKAF